MATLLHTLLGYSSSITRVRCTGNTFSVSSCQDKINKGTRPCALAPQKKTDTNASAMLGTPKQE